MHCTHQLWKQNIISNNLLKRVVIINVYIYYTSSYHKCIHYIFITLYLKTLRIARLRYNLGTIWKFKNADRKCWISQKSTAIVLKECIRLTKFFNYYVLTPHMTIIIAFYTFLNIRKETTVFHRINSNIYDYQHLLLTFIYISSVFSSVGKIVGVTRYLRLLMIC